MATKAQRARAFSPDELRERIHAFVSGCREPVVVEIGEKPIVLTDGQYAVEPHAKDCVLQVWGDGGNIVRRIVGIERERNDRLDLLAKTFGRGDIKLALIDRARHGDRLDREAGHVQFREALRRMLERDYPDYSLSHLSTAPDLENSLSPVYARAKLDLGHEAWAVIGGSAELDSASCDQILTFGLIWFDYLRRREQRRVLRGLKVFLPRSRSQVTANRLAFLNRASFHFELYDFDASGHVRRVDDRDHGNLATELRPCLPVFAPEQPVADWVRQLAALPGVEALPRSDGLLSLRVRGIQFAIAGRGVMTSGLERQSPVGPENFDRVMTLARELARLRSPDTTDTTGPLYRRHPESWLESQVRCDLRILDSTLLSESVYSHVPAVAGPDRGIIDLLACSREGRLVVLELKASEDIHLPLQGLDYWMRVKWHLDREEFSSRGYFPGIEVSSQPPRLVLVSPGFDFHPTTEVLLRYLSPDVEVERVGVSAEWRSKLKVVFRKRGAGRIA